MCPLLHWIKDKLKNKRKTIIDYGKWPRSWRKGNRRTHVQKQGCIRNFKEEKMNENEQAVNIVSLEALWDSKNADWAKRETSTWLFTWKNNVYTKKKVCAGEETK